MPCGTTPVGITDDFQKWEGMASVFVLTNLQILAINKNLDPSLRLHALSVDMID